MSDGQTTFEASPAASRPGLDFIAGGGEMGALIRAHDWSGSALGPPETWPQALRTVIRLMLNTRHPMYVFWGQDGACFYNDAYRLSIGPERHPSSLGRPAQEVWAEIWPIIGPQVEQVMSGRGATWHENALVPITRNGRLEDVYWTYSFSPIDDEASLTGVGGVLVVCTETTEAVRAQQRQAFLIALDAALLESEDPRGVMQRAAALLGGHLKVGRCGYGEVDAAGVHFTVETDWTDGAMPSLRGTLRLDDFGPALIDEFRAGRIVRMDDHLEDPRTQGASAAYDTAGRMRSGLAAPLVRNGRFVAALFAHAAEPRQWSDGDVELMREVSERTWTAVERARAETALIKAQELIRLTISNAQIIGAWDWDVAADLVRADERFAQLYGVDPEEAARGAPLATFTRAVHPEDVDRVGREIETSLATGDPLATEYRLTQADGSVRHVLARGAGVTGADGRVIRLPGVVVDVTDLRQTEQTLRLTQEAGHVGVFELDPETGLLDVSDEFCRLFGFEPCRPTLSSEEVMAILVPGNSPSHVMSAEPHAPNPLGAAEYQIRRPNDGELRWIARQAQAISDGARTRLVGVVQDVTERRRIEDALRESEDQFRTLAQAMPSQVWTGRPDGQLDWFNGLVLAYGGLAYAELEGSGWTSMVHPEDLPAAGERWAAALASGDTYETEFRLRRADGAYRWHIARAVAIRDDDGAIVRWVGTNTDIEDQKATAEALLHLNATLEQQVDERTAELMVAEESLRQSQKMDAVGQLTGGIAHDFNNMLAVVLGSLDLLNRRIGSGDARAARYVNAATDGARRAALLTQRLLAFSRQQPLQPEALDVNRLVAGMSDLLAHWLGGEVRLETVLAEDLWRVHADPNQLENVILNLGVNSRDAMPGGGLLTIETRNLRLDGPAADDRLGVPVGDYVMIAVSDTGAGMTQDVIAKAFDPFFTTKDIGKGTGLGLSQVYGFIRQSGGHVKICSEPGQGTTVKVYLPRLIGDERERPLAATATVAARGGGQDLVLVVEDEPAVRQFSTDALGELGYRVLEADGAAAALALLDSNPDLVLLFTDVMMPDVNGRKLADEALRRRPGLKVLFTTGYTSDAVVHNGILDAGVAMIGKPFTLDELAAKVREVIDAPG